MKIVVYEWKIYPRKQDDVSCRLPPMTLGAGLQGKPKADVAITTVIASTIGSAPSA